MTQVFVVMTPKTDVPAGLVSTGELHAVFSTIDAARAHARLVADARWTGVVIYKTELDTPEPMEPFHDSDKAEWVLMSGYEAVLDEDRGVMVAQASG